MIASELKPVRMVWRSFPPVSPPNSVSSSRFDPEEAREYSEEQRDLVAADVGLGDGLCDGEVDLERETIPPLEEGARGFDDVAQPLRLSLRVTKLLAQIRDIVGRR